MELDRQRERLYSTMCILLCSSTTTNKQTNLKNKHKHTVVRVRLTLSRAREAAFTHDGWGTGSKGSSKWGNPLETLLLKSGGGPEETEKTCKIKRLKTCTRQSGAKE